MAFLGERICVVGHTCVCTRERPLPLIPGLLEGDAARDGDDWREGEAGQPPLGWPAWTMCYWTGNKVRESAIGIGSMIRTLLEEIWLWLDLLGAGRVELSMALDLGVFGEDA